MLVIGSSVTEEVVQHAHFFPYTFMNILLKVDLLFPRNESFSKSDRTFPLLQDCDKRFRGKLNLQCFCADPLLQTRPSKRVTER